jgi:hypothetical protein
MPRLSEVKPKAIRKEVIAKRVKDSVYHDNLPIWEGKEGVQCKVISMPLDHLLFRLENRRTYDAQKYSAAINSTFERKDGTPSVPAKKETFDSKNQGEQDSQDHQYELLIVEARKVSGRVGDLNLMQILQQKGWKPKDRPVITPEGVLVNGNCRVAAIEYLLQEGTTIPGIASSAPFIEVKVTPTNPVNNKNIDELERALQHGDTGRLDYDWIQTTSDMRRQIEIESQAMSRGDAKKEVHAMYSHVTRYAKMSDMDNWLEARSLLEQTLQKIGLKGQAYGLKLPEQLFLSSAKLRLKGTKNGWWKRKHNIQLLNILAVLIQISMFGNPLRELRYEIEEIKNEDDLAKLHQTFVDDGYITIPVPSPPPVSQATPKRRKRPSQTKISITKLDSAQLASSAKVVRDTSADIRDSHDVKDLETKPKKKLEEIKNNLRYYSLALEKAATHTKVVDKDELKTLFSEIQKMIEDKLKELSE